jgi:SulP family sulfate permease
MLRMMFFSSVVLLLALSNAFIHSVSVHNGFDAVKGIKTTKAKFSHALQKPTSRLLSQPDSTVTAQVDTSSGKDGALTREILAGLVVSLATIPTSISYSTVVGVKPLVGIWSSALVGFFASLIGGAPGLIVGSAGVTALPMAKMFSTLGPAYMAFALIFASAMEAFFGIFKLSHLANIVTEPVIAGFLNALAIFIIKAQLKIFKGYGGAWLTGLPLTASLGVSIFTASAIFGLAPYRKQIKVPPPLLALVLSTLATVLLKFPIKSLNDFAGKGEFVGGLAALPKLVPLSGVSFSGNVITTLLATASGVATVCIVETLLAQRIQAEQLKGLPKDEQPVQEPNRAMIGLGVGNFASALIGGFGGCGLVPNTLLNLSNGGRGTISGLSYSLCTVLAIIFASPLLGKIPMAALAGLMLTVAYNTFEWKETWHLIKESTHSFQAVCDAVAMAVTTYIAFKIDMGLGIAAGVAIAKFPAVVKLITGK